MPKCIGIILDGNRRWAKKHGLQSAGGHREGAETLKRIVRAARDRGVAHVIVYAFSTENWKRSEEEVNSLFSLIQEHADTPGDELAGENGAIRFVGQIDRFNDSVKESIRRIEGKSRPSPDTTLWICLSYGGRAEILAAANASARESAGQGAEITEEVFASNLWTAGMPDPDIIIRTGGEKRLSGFLLWQCAYSELFFTPTLWPDFSADELDDIIAEFQTRERRIGK